MRATLSIMIEAVVFTFGVAVGVVLLHNFDAKPSDWLGFAGALIGAAVTVFGALLVVEMQTPSAERAKRRLLTDQLKEILRWAQAIREPNESETTGLDLVRKANADELREAIARLKQTRQWVTPDNARMIRALSVIQNLPDQVQVWFGLRDKPSYVPFDKVETNLQELEGGVQSALRLLGN